MMQTFLPYEDFDQTARCLDTKRLCKQRVEAKQIALILGGETPNSSWRYHPAVKMWDGSYQALLWYGACMCAEWVARGYKDTQWKWFIQRRITGHLVQPPWLGHPTLHASHRSNLLRKNAEHYARFGWSEPPTMPYFWPTKEPYVFTQAPHQDGAP